MRFGILNIETVLSQLEELPADWMDETGRTFLEQVPVCVKHLRELGRTPTLKDVEECLQEHAAFLDICRLFLGKGQEPTGHMLCDELGGERMTWSRLRKLATQEAARMAQALVAIGLPDIITDQLQRRWEIEDVLVERYKMSRGRAVAGQKRGRALENDVDGVLRDVRVPFDSRVSFVGKKGATAKCDFAIPDRNHPKIVIEAKGFEATGSKLTDLLRDVLEIGEAKEYHMYFFLVTDGRGWHNRRSDLQKLVDYQNEGLIDMIHTRSTLSGLAADVKHIYEKE